MDSQSPQFTCPDQFRLRLFLSIRFRRICFEITTEQLGSTIFNIGRVYQSRRIWCTCKSKIWGLLRAFFWEANMLHIIQKRWFRSQVNQTAEYLLPSVNRCPELRCTLLGALLLLIKRMFVGSIPERSDGKLFNTCCIYGPNGKLLGKHRKVSRRSVRFPFPFWCGRFILEAVQLMSVPVIKPNHTPGSGSILWFSKPRTIVSALACTEVR